MAVMNIFRSSKSYVTNDFLYPAWHDTEDGKVAYFDTNMIDPISDASRFMDKVFTEANGDTK